MEVERPKRLQFGSATRKSLAVLRAVASSKYGIKTREIAEFAHLDVKTVQHHLRILRAAGVVMSNGSERIAERNEAGLFVAGGSIASVWSIEPKFLFDLVENHLDWLIMVREQKEEAKRV